MSGVARHGHSTPAGKPKTYQSWQDMRAAADARDSVLSKAAEIACQALVKLGSKGAQWLFLADEA